MRLTLNDDEVQELMKVISKFNYPLYFKIQEQFNQDVKRDITKKQDAIKQATKHRIEATKQKILNAKVLLRAENKKLTAYAIAKISGCSYNTVKKYQLKGVQDER